jgi:excinuclease ABC subunit A
MIPKIHRKVKTIQDVGLGYITLGQQSTTLSGGKPNIKPGNYLKDTGNTFISWMNPLQGFEDIRVLMGVINTLVDKGIRS